MTVLTDAAAGRLMLFAALLATVERLGAGRPVLLTIDDFHLADTATVDWVHFTVLRGSALAVVAAERPGIRRVEDVADRVRLGPLDLAAAAAIVGDDRAADLHERSGGNPLFLLELARATDSLPAGIRDAVEARADALGAEAARTVRAAAVLGPEIDFDMLGGVLDRPVAWLLDDVELATGAGLLLAAGPSYQFAHELTREALGAGVTAARRAFFHRQGARVLARRRGRGPSCRGVARSPRRRYGARGRGTPRGGGSRGGPVRQRGSR